MEDFDPTAHNMDARRLQYWFQRALGRYYKDNEGPWAFEPLELEIGKSASLEFDLAGVYSSLPCRVQMEWRRAVKDVLAEQGRNPEHRDETICIVDLAAIIGASEVLEVFPGILAHSDDSHLYEHVVTAAIELANQTEDARTCLNQIRTSPNFPFKYAGLLLTALCYVDPNSWVNHVLSANAFMEKLAEEQAEDSEVLVSYAAKILDAVSLYRVAESWVEFSGLVPNAPENWLWRAFFEGRGGKKPLIYWRDMSLEAGRSPGVSERLADADTALGPATTTRRVAVVDSGEREVSLKNSGDRKNFETGRNWCEKKGFA